MSVVIKGMKIPEHFTRAEFGLDADGHNQVLIYYNDGPPKIYDVFELSDQQFEKMPQKVKVYGYSDDIVVIERSCYKQREIDCFNKDVIIHFEDGTVIRIGYSKPDIGVWYIIIEQNGTAPQTLTICENDEADIYSDIFDIESEVLSHEIVQREM